MSRFTSWLKGSATALVAASLAASAFGDSVAELRARAKTVPNPAEALVLARQLRRAGLLPEAKVTLERSFAKARGNDAVADIRLELARTYIDQNLAKRALAECDQIHKYSRFKEQLCQAEAQLLGRRGSMALPAAEEALSLSPGDYDALVAKGRALSQLSRPAEAEATLRDAAKANPSRPEAFLHLAEVLLANGDKAGGEQALRDARKADPDDPDVLLLVGSRLPAGPEARDVLEHALTVRPDFAPAQARLGQVLQKLGSLDQAEQDLTAALKTDPRQADWRAALGEVHLAKGEADLALQDAEAALKIVANHGPAKFLQAKALAAKGDVDLAMEAFQDAYSASARTDPTVLIEATHACIKGNRYTTAKAFADRATEDFPKSSAAWEAEGDVGAALHDAPLAREAYGKALGGDDSASKDEIRRKLAQFR